MAKRKDQEPATDQPAGKLDGAGGAKPGFPVHEHIGRTLKALFDEVTTQPVPEKLLDLLEELERKKTKKS
jgi:Anti-sigma factor NepR